MSVSLWETYVYDILVRYNYSGTEKYASIPKDDKN